MLEKVDIIKDSENCVDSFGYTHNVAGHNVINKINELIDAVNNLQKGYDNVCVWVGEQKLKARVENVQPDYVTTTYMTDGHTKEYYGQNGASVVTDHPLPAGYVITIREPETKGDDNE